MDATLGRRRRAATPRTLGRLAATAMVAGALLVPTATTLAVAPAPSTAGSHSIVVDGDRGEWDLAADQFADMFRAGKTTKKVESRLFLRYDCDGGVLYAMVETVDGVALQSGGDQFVKVDGRKRAGSSDVGDFALSADGRGWEASLALGPGTYDLDVHAQVLDGGSQTSAVAGRSIPLVVECPPGGDPVVAPAASAEPSPNAEPSPSPSLDPGAEPTPSAATDPGPSVDPSPSPSVAPSTAGASEPPADPSPDEGAAGLPGPSAQPEPVSGASPSSAVPSDPIDGAPEQGTDQGPAPTDEVEPDLSSDPDPHDVVNGPTGICGCEPEATEPTYESAVLGIVSDPSVTPPPTDTLASETPVPASTSGLPALALGLVLTALATLAVVRRRAALERS